MVIASNSSASVQAQVPRGVNGQQVAHEDNNSQQSTKPNTSSIRPVKCFYLDELGFYRHLDPDQGQYFCSNTSWGKPTRGDHQFIDQQQNDHNQINHKRNGKLKNQEHRISTGDGGYEICFKAVRKDLGISHFDRIDDYSNWKREWDEFMRVKLTSRQPVTLNTELKYRVRSGIPHDYRCKVWSALIRMRTRAIRAQIGDDIYEAIISKYVSKAAIPNYTNLVDVNEDVNNNQKKSPNEATNNNNKYASGSSYLGASFASNNEQQKPRIPSKESLIEKCFKQIELDLLRTLPNNRHFEDPNSIGIQRVRRVLRAYACFNQSVGYCQGMNRLAAMALLVLPEEEAFWCLVAIIQCIMPKDYYLKPWLAQVDCCVLGEILQKKMPKLHKHLEKNDIQLTLFTWFFTIFVDGFRPELMLRIWDCFLLEGDKVLFRFALAILNICQDELLEMNELSTMSSHLSRMVSTRQLDMEHLFEIAFRMMNPLSSATIQSRRDFHRNKFQSTLEE